MKHKLKSLGQSMCQPVVAITLAFILAAICIRISGFSPMDVYTSIFKGALGNKNALLSTLFNTTPILFTGLAFAVAARAGLVNIGVEGQLCAGAFVAAMVGVYMPSMGSGFVHVLVAIVLAMVAGALCALFVGFMKVRYHAHEFITSLMINMIILFVTGYFVTDPFKAEGDVAQSGLIQESARLMMLNARAQLSVGIVIALILAVILYYYFTATTAGYEMNIVGLNPQAASFAGISINGIILRSMVYSGAIGGLCGAVYVLGYAGRYVDGFSPGFGFDGIAVATLAGSNPLGCILSALIFGGLKAGSINLNIMTRVPIEFVDLIQAVVIVVIAAPKMIKAFINLGAKKKSMDKRLSTKRKPVQEVKQ